MKRSILFLALLAAAGFAVSAQVVYVSPDVPTDPDGAFLLPWDMVECDPASASPYTVMLSVVGNPAVDAMHKMDKPGHWLFSVEVPDDLAGVLGGNVAEPRDVVRYSAGLYGLFFDGSCVGGVVPLESSIDALYLEGGDTGDLIVSFDVPTSIGASTFQPSELVRYVRVGGGACGWALSVVPPPSVIDFRTASLVYYPVGTNVTGVDDLGSGEWIVALDIPVDLQPSAPFPGPTYEPGFVAKYDQGAASWDLFLDMQVVGVQGWPLEAYADALSCGANPGRVYDLTVYPFPILMGKSSTVAGDVYITWAPSCSAADDHGIYEGTIGTWYSHVKKFCTDPAPQYTEVFTPQAASSYYLVVPQGCQDDGSFGKDSSGTERPQPAAVAARCYASQDLTPCPP